MTARCTVSYVCANGRLHTTYLDADPDVTLGVMLDFVSTHDELAPACAPHRVEIAARPIWPVGETDDD